MNSISVNISESPQNKDITLLTVNGEIDTLTARVFEKNFISALSAKKFKLVIELTNVSYISSAGWGIFVSEIKRIRNENGDLVLAGMNPAVTEVFELLEFNVILKSFADVESAVKKGFKAKVPSAK